MEQISSAAHGLLSIRSRTGSSLIMDYSIIATRSISFHPTHQYLATCTPPPSSFPPAVSKALQLGKGLFSLPGAERLSSSSSSGARSSRSWTATTSCRCDCPSVYSSTRPFPTSSSGLSNLSVSGTTRHPFGLTQKMARENGDVQKAEAARDSLADELQENGKPPKTRRVLDHIGLFKMKDTMTDEEEKDMLDNLWSLQYRIKNVLFTTVGRLVQKTPEGYTHALLSRFPSKEALEEFLGSGMRWRVAQDYVIPYYDGKIFADFEGDIEDEIEPIFRRGDDFQEGVEHFVLLKLKDGVSQDAEEKFMNAANALPEKYLDLVQLIAGPNLNSESREHYTHGLVARLISEEARLEFETFLRNDPSWKDVMQLFDTAQTLVANYVVSPVGKTVM